MIVKITAKRQVTLPAHVLDEMGVGPGDTLQLIPGPDGYLLRPRHIDDSRLGTLRSKFRAATRNSKSGHSARSPMTQPYGIDTSVPTRAAKSALTALIHQNPSPQNRRRGP